MDALEQARAEIDTVDAEMAALLRRLVDVGEVLRDARMRVEAVDDSQLPATEVASLRESFDTSICLDRPGLLHSQSCEVQQRSGNYQSH